MVSLEIIYNFFGNYLGKIERSADAFQGCHTLFLCPFEKLYDKPARATGRQNVERVAIVSVQCSVFSQPTEY